jgi:hypothetical protein
MSRRVSVVRRLLLVALVLVILGGAIAWKVMADRPEASTGTVTPADSASFVLPDSYQPTQEEQAWIDSHTGAAGAYSRKFGDYLFALVTMGEKPTGGFAVEIAQVGVSGDKWVVDVRFVSPGANDIVIQAFTYPFGYVKIKSDGKGLVIRDVTGQAPVELTVTEE